MTKNRNRTRVFAVLICVCLLLFLIPQAAYAADTGSLTVYYRQDGVKFSLYKVTDEKDSPAAAFVGCGVKLPLASDSAAAWQSAAQALEDYVKERGVSGVRQEETYNGVIRFAGLESGSYLVLGETFVKDGRTYSPIPVLVRVSASGAVVYVKHETGGPDTPDKPTDPDDPDKPTDPDDPDKPTDPDDPDKPTNPDDPDDPTDPDDPDKPTIPGGSDDPSSPADPGSSSGPALPQTGQLNWPIPLMAALGLCLLSEGWILCRRPERESHEK